jgi:hypothetical protein
MVEWHLLYLIFQTTVDYFSVHHFHSSPTNITTYNLAFQKKKKKHFYTMWWILFWSKYVHFVKKIVEFLEKIIRSNSKLLKSLLISQYCHKFDVHILSIFWNVKKINSIKTILRNSFTHLYIHVLKSNLVIGHCSLGKY